MTGTSALMEGIDVMEGIGLCVHYANPFGWWVQYLQTKDEFKLPWPGPVPSYLEFMAESGVPRERLITPQNQDRVAKLDEISSELNVHVRAGTVTETYAIQKLNEVYETLGFPDAKMTDKK